MDFEATCERDDRSWPHEIIEFPAQLLDAGTLEVVSEFREFVRPTERPGLTAFCTELTGIRQEDVATADVLEGVLGRFGEWLEAHVGRDAGAAAVLPVTCGDWDLRQMLPKEAKRKRLSYPPTLKGWCNIKVPFEEALGSKAWGMAGMLSSLGLELVGRHHSGIDDTRNIASILIELVQRFRHPITWTAGKRPEPAAPAAAPRAGADRSEAAVPSLGAADCDDSNADRASMDPAEREVEVRRLRKKLQQMEALEQKQQRGKELKDEQLQKLARLPEVRRQLAELTAEAPDACDG